MKIFNDKQSINNDFLRSEPENPNFILFFAMLSMTLTICKGLFSYRLASINGHVIQAGQLIIPLWFVLSGVITEVYGYRRATTIIYLCLICQIIFSLISFFLVNLPYPENWKEYNSYQIVFGGMLRVSLSVYVSFYISAIINSKLIIHLRLFLANKFFILRLMSASIFAETLYTIIATYLIQFNRLSHAEILAIIKNAILIKIIVTYILAIPVFFLLIFLKKYNVFQNKFEEKLECK